MTVGERIKILCRVKGISVNKLEKDLNYGNGSLASATDKIQSNRAIEIADYFNVSLNYLLTGTESDVKTKELDYEAVGFEDAKLLLEIRSLSDSNYALLKSIVKAMTSQEQTTDHTGI